MSNKEVGINRVNLLWTSILAGMLIGIAGTVYLQTNQSLIGSALFSFGLIFIVINGYTLYTGKIGFLNFKIKSNWFDIPFMIFGNFLGTTYVAYTLKFTRYGESLINKASMVYNNKLNDSYLSLFILAIFCGFLMYLAIKNYAGAEEDNFSIVFTFLPVMVFILCGFEHSIADMFYLNLAKNISNYNLKDLFTILIILVGNGIGAKIIPAIRKISNLK